MNDLSKALKRFSKDIEATFLKAELMAADCERCVNGLSVDASKCAECSATGRQPIPLTEFYGA